MMAGKLAPGADGAGPALPIQPVHRVRGDRAEGGDGPGRRVVGGVLADPIFARVHQRGDLGGVAAAVGVGDGGEPRGPGTGLERDQGADPIAEAGCRGRRGCRGLRLGPVRRSRRPGAAWRRVRRVSA